MGSFVGATSDASSLELTAVKEVVDLLNYQLAYVERNNSELAKELGFSEEACRKAQEIINHQDDKLRKTERRIKNLERQRSRAERDWHHAQDDLEHLRRTLRGKRNRNHASLEAHSQRSPNRSSAKEHLRGRKATLSKGFRRLQSHLSSFKKLC